jgi:uncharacterized protein
MDFDILVKFNPWWVKGSVPEQFLGEHKRLVFDSIKNRLSERFIVLLFGLRRVGKTTTFYQLIQHLIESKIKSEKILYFSFDELGIMPDEVLTAFEEKMLKKKISDCNERIFVFFDEIQKIKNWQDKIKIIYDLHPNIKLFLSGSASISLQKNSKESLAGRMIEFFVEPLSFSEFLNWKKINFNEKKPELFQNELMPLFMDYLRKGGFPEIIFEEKDEIIRDYIKNTVLERIIFKDIPQEFELKDLELLKLLLESFIKEPGMIINLDKMSLRLGKSKITLSNYIEYLEFSLLLRKVKNLRSNLLVSSRKGKKIYPTNTAFCFALMPDFYSDKQLERIAEVSVASHLKAEYYYKNGFEVDFINKKNNEIIPFEVKFGNPEQFQIKKFLQKFNLNKGIIISKKLIQKEKNGIKIMPLWQFLLKKQ